MDKSESPPPSIEELLNSQDWEAKLAEARAKRQQVLAARAAEGAPRRPSPPKMAPQMTAPAAAPLHPAPPAASAPQLSQDGTVVPLRRPGSATPPLRLDQPLPHAPGAAPDPAAARARPRPRMAPGGGTTSGTSSGSVPGDAALPLQFAARRSAAAVQAPPSAAPAAVPLSAPPAAGPVEPPAEPPVVAPPAAAGEPGPREMLERFARLQELRAEPEAATRAPARAAAAAPRGRGGLAIVLALLVGGLVGAAVTWAAVGSGNGGGIGLPFVAPRAADPAPGQGSALLPATQGAVAAESDGQVAGGSWPQQAARLPPLAGATALSLAEATGTDAPAPVLLATAGAETAPLAVLPFPLEGAHPGLPVAAARPAPDRPDPAEVAARQARSAAARRQAQEDPVTRTLRRVDRFFRQLGG